MTTARVLIKNYQVLLQLMAEAELTLPLRINEKKLLLQIPVALLAQTEQTGLWMVHVSV